MAAEWIPCGSGFVEADVIRWKDAAWERRRRGRAVNAGNRIVVAEVIREYRNEWVELLVRGSTIVSEKPGWLLKPLLTNLAVRRRRRTIERGNPSGAMRAPVLH
jgi:hypothetical protein